MLVTLLKGKYAQSGADRGKVDAIDIYLQDGAIRTIATSWENTDKIVEVSIVEVSTTLDHHAYTIDLENSLPFGV
jgi:hypothetical protein